MTGRPTGATVGGRAYLDLLKAASVAGRPSDEFLQLDALEGFLDRLGSSPHAEHFVLKGGVLLAAYDARRPTRDIDLAGLDVANDLDNLLRIINKIVARESPPWTVTRPPPQFPANTAGVPIQPLREGLASYPRIAQSPWSAWRRKLRLTTSTPEQFADLLDLVLAFTEPVLQRADIAP